MFTPKWTDRATREYQRLKGQAEKVRAGRKKTARSKSSRQEGLFKQVHKAIRLLLANPRHPSLCTHPYDSLSSPFDASATVFEAYAQNDTPGAYRIFWCYGPGRREISIIAITPHP